MYLTNVLYTPTTRTRGLGDSVWSGFPVESDEDWFRVGKGNVHIRQFYNDIKRGNDMELVRYLIGNTVKKLKLIPLEQLVPFRKTKKVLVSMGNVCKKA